MSLDELTRTATAFDTWADLVESMLGGYCPTLRVSDRKPRGRRQQDYEAAVALLADQCRDAGFRVFDGRTVR